MQWLFPFCTPFIPSKCYASLYRYTTTPSHLCASFPREIAHLPQENEIFFVPCNSLAYGEMNATQRSVLRNILR